MTVQNNESDDFELWSPSEERQERCLFGRRVCVLHVSPMNLPHLFFFIRRSTTEENEKPTVL